MSDDALVSVVIPTHYRNDWLPGAIESVLTQTYDPFELIVVDDSGEAHARPVVEEYETGTEHHVTYVAHDENRGGNPARNTGIERADGEYVQLLDDDDRLTPTKIARQVDLLGSSSDVGVAYCGLSRGDRTVYPKRAARGEVLDSALMNELAPCMTSTMLIDSTHLQAVYPLESRRAADDIGLKIELADRCLFDYVDEILVRKGQPDQQRSEGIVVAEELEQIHEQYDHLFDRLPPRVHARARSNRLQQRGLQRLSDCMWSLESIRDFLRSARSAPGWEIESAGLAVAALFGRPGRDAGIALYRVVQRISGGQICRPRDSTISDSSPVDTAGHSSTPHPDRHTDD
jgi:hypothetical protein